MFINIVNKYFDNKCLKLLNAESKIFLILSKNTKAQCFEKLYVAVVMKNRTKLRPWFELKKSLNI